MSDPKSTKDAYLQVVANKGQEANKELLFMLSRAEDEYDMYVKKKKILIMLLYLFFLVIGCVDISVLLFFL